MTLLLTTILLFLTFVGACEAVYLSTEPEE